MWETFLLQVDDFDRFLQMQLRLMLAPVIAFPAPPRRFREEPVRQPMLTLEIPAQPTDAIHMVEPVVLAVPAAAPQL